MKTRPIRLLALLTFLTLLLFNSTLLSAQQPAAAAEQELQVVELAGWRSSSLLHPSQFGGTGVAELMYLRMVGIDPMFQPTDAGLAESWTFNDDRTELTITLKTGFEFSDGTPVTAAEAAWSLGHILMTGHPDLAAKFPGSTAARYWSGLEGAQAIFDGDVAADEFGAAEVSGIEVVDDTTIRLKFDRPSMVLSLEPLQMWYIVSPNSVMAGTDKEYGPDEYWTTDPTTAFSGPWMLESYESGAEMTLVPNPNWVGGAPTLTRIRSQFIADTATAIALFENQEVDVVLLPVGPDVAATLQSSEYLASSLRQVTDYSVNQLLITAFPPMEDVHVRRAFTHAIDRVALADVLGGGEGQSVFRPIFYHHSPGAVPTCNEQFAGIVPLAYDPEAARAELAQSDYADTIADMEINITLGMFGEPVERGLVEAQVIQAMLQSNLGLNNIVIHQEPMADFANPTYATHLWQNSQGEKTVDVYSFMMNLVPLSGPVPEDESEISMLNLPDLPDLRDLMGQAGAQSDPVAMCEILTQAQQVWVDQVFTIDLFTFDSFRLVAPWVQNFASYGGDSNYLSSDPGIATTYLSER